MKNALSLLLFRKDVVNALKERGNLIRSDILPDITDGAFYQNFVDNNGVQYLKNYRNLAGLINVDWLQPYENVNHSVGVIYLVLINLPREIRFRKENVIIIGVIPGPKEPKGNINFFLKPLVDELLDLWNGFIIKENDGEAYYKFVLIGSSSDLPATGKLCGFTSYNLRKVSYKTLPRFSNIMTMILVCFFLNLRFSGLNSAKCSSVQCEKVVWCSVLC